LITPETKFYCPGSATFWGRSFACHKKEGHGAVDVRHAIEKSCNVFFYNVANLLKIDTIYKYAQLLGLVGKTGIDLPGEIESLVPSEEWKRRRFNDRWYPGETISVGIGQGAVSVTPIGLATMMASFANGGTRVVPHVAKAIDIGDGSGWRALDRPAPKTLFELPHEVVQPIREGLWMVVNAAGTAGSARIDGFDVIGKTGTAQVIGNEARAKVGRTALDLRDHAWFVFAAPRDNPEIAGVVLVEHGEHGSTSSTPIARFVLQTYLAKKQKKPLPVWRSPLAPPVQAASAAPPAPPSAPSPQ
jgi:penicillin-binding protein 2